MSVQHHAQSHRYIFFHAIKCLLAAIFFYSSWFYLSCILLLLAAYVISISQCSSVFMAEIYVCHSHCIIVVFLHFSVFRTLQIATGLKLQDFHLNWSTFLVLWTSAIFLTFSSRILFWLSIEQYQSQTSNIGWIFESFASINWFESAGGFPFITVNLSYANITLFLRLKDPERFLKWSPKFAIIFGLHQGVRRLMPERPYWLYGQL